MNPIRFLYLVVVTMTALIAAFGSTMGRSELDGLGDPSQSPQYVAHVTIGTRAISSHRWL